MGAIYKNKLGTRLLLVNLLLLFSILLIFNNVKANPLPVYVQFNFDMSISSSIINIISLFIVNLPVNLTCILLIHFVLIKKFESSGNFNNIPLLSLFNLAIIVSIIGAVIDAYFYNYQLALLSIEKIKMGGFNGMFIIGIGLIFLSFLVFSNLVLGYKLKSSLILAILMIVMNIIFWTAFVIPGFEGIKSDEIFEVQYLLSLIFGLFLLSVTLLVVFLSKSRFGKKHQLPELNRSWGNKNRVRLGGTLVIVLTLTLVYLSPIINYQDDDIFSPDNAVVHDQSVIEEGNYGTRVDRNEYDNTRSGYTQENSESEVRIDLLSGSLYEVEFELLWEDEQVAGPLYENHPDCFQIKLKKPSGEVERSPTSDSGVLIFNYSVQENEMENWNESIDFFIVALDCGDQDGMLQTLQDNGNNWTVHLEIKTIDHVITGRYYSNHTIYLLIFKPDLVWILITLTTISILEVTKRKINKKVIFERVS